MPSLDDKWIAYGLLCSRVCYLALWRMQSENDIIEIPLEKFNGENISVKIGYPEDVDLSWNINKIKNILIIRNKHNYSGRILEIRW